MNKRKTVVVRVTPDEHRLFRVLAALKGKSVNQMVIEVIQEKAATSVAIGPILHGTADNDEFAAESVIGDAKPLG